MGPGTTDSGDQGPGGAEDTVSGARASHSASASSVSRANRFLPLSLSLLIRMMGILRPICDKVRKGSHCGTATGSRPLGHCGGTEGKFKVENVTFQHPVFLPPPPLPREKSHFEGWARTELAFPGLRSEARTKCLGNAGGGVCVCVCVCARACMMWKSRSGKGREQRKMKKGPGMLCSQHSPRTVSSPP